jgi:4,5-dihydroxyphthalate decarboxylase
MFGRDYEELHHLQDHDIAQEFDLDIEVNLLTTPHDVFHRLSHSDEGDGGEMSFSFYATALSTFGDDHEFVGIPVFSYREYPESHFLVSEKSGIEHPTELVGCVIGLPEYGMSRSVWLRGRLQHEFGVAPSDITWMTGRDPVALDGDVAQYPKGVNVTRGGDVGNFLNMLADGDIEAFIGPHGPTLPPGVRPLFPDVQSAEGYYRERGVFPIMHVVVLRRSAYDHDPGVASNLFNACVAAQRRWASRSQASRHSDGAANPWPYGIAANRQSFQEFLMYMSEQGLLSGPLGSHELLLALEPDETHTDRT